MSYRTQKRRLQRHKHAEKIAWWKSYREYSARQAFEEWKKNVYNVKFPLTRSRLEPSV